MSTEELVAGKAWVNDRLVELANNMNIPIQGYEWEHEIESYSHMLVLHAGGMWMIMSLSEPDLRDCIDDETIQSKLSYRMNKLVKSLVR